MHQKCKAHNIRSQQTNIAPKTSSYSCTKNVKSIITGHNKQILHPEPPQYGCNCRDKNNYPLHNKCLTPQIVYQADVTNDTDDTYKYYLGLAKTSFKDRYRKHVSSFNNEQQKNKAELSKYVWSLENENKTVIINWKIMKTVYSKATSEFCKLYLMEKLYILNAIGDDRCLKKITEFISKCRHQNKLPLKNVKDGMD